MNTDIDEWYESTEEETQLENEADQEIDAVESPDAVSASNSSYKGNGEKSRSKELKEQISLSRLLARDRYKITSGGKYNKCLCPFHDERTPSFCIDEDKNTGKCFGCGWYGDVYAYEMKKHGIGFYDALQQLEKKAKFIKRTSPLNNTTQPANKAAGHVLTPEQVQIQQAASKRLAEDFDLCQRVAEKRGWSPETIQKLAEDGSLGNYKGDLAFNYDTGMKLRNWPHREFAWEFGGACVWRRKRIASATDIILCEGETDAIALIDTGLEDDAKFAVVALPSATSITSDLIDLLRGKDVTLCMDNDEAGALATEKLIDLLVPVCASVLTFNYGEVDSHE